MGINFFSAELAAKRLELLRELVPGATRVGVLLNPTETAIAAANLRDVETAARAMGLDIRVLNASNRDEIDAAYATFAGERPDALFISSGPFFSDRRVQMAHLSTRYALPAIHGSRLYAEVGGLISYSNDLKERHLGVSVAALAKHGAVSAQTCVTMANGARERYGADIAHAYRQAGTYAGRVLKGVKPADLPVVQSSKFELVVNLHAAKLVGITVPPTLLARADEVIE